MTTTTASTYKNVILERRGAITTLVVSRPEVLNALNRETLAEIEAAALAFASDPEQGALIVTGAGEKSFISGADIQELAPLDPRGAEEISRMGQRVVEALERATKPVIAAINGPAVGFGATMTLPMDIRVASSAARIGFVFSRRGVVPEACSTWFLPRLVGMQRAAEWVYTGRVFGAEEALAGGLVSRVVAPGELLPTAVALAREIADNTSAISVALARQMMWKLLGADHPMAGHRLDSRGMDWTGRSADAREGIASFLEKRPPRFSLKPSRDMPPFYPWWSEHTFR